MSSLLVAFALAAPVYGEIPVQGTATDAAGAPLHGTVPVTLTLYRQPSSGGPVVVWSAQRDVVFAAGGFAATVGGTPTLDLMTLDAAPLYVTITVDGGPESALVPVGFAPRAGFAVNAANLGGRPASDYLADDELLPWSRVDPATIPVLGRIYTPGAGLALDGTTFSSTVAYNAGTGLALNGTTFSSTVAYNAGAGLALNGTTFSNTVAYSAGAGLALNGTTFSNTIAYSAGAGLALNGTTFSNTIAYTAGAGLALNGGTFALTTTGVSAGSYTSANVTIDANGRVTSASNGSGGAAVATGGSRPTTGLVPGLLFLNTSTKDLDVYDGAAWRTILVGATRQSCKQIRQQTGTTTSGVYTIKPSAATPETSVYCEFGLGGGDWTLVSNRKAHPTNIDACGGNLAAFFTNGCGAATSIGFNESYAMPASVRTQIPFTQVMILQYSDANTPDLDDAYIMNTSLDLFQNTTPTTNTPIASVCDINGLNCDASDVWFKYTGGNYFGSTYCNSGTDAGYGGNYGLCHNGVGSAYFASSLYGGRSAYDETKLWNHESGASGYRERIFVR
jgi:hypothetical protein